MVKKFDILKLKSNILSQATYTSFYIDVQLEAVFEVAMNSPKFSETIDRYINKLKKSSNKYSLKVVVGLSRDISYTEQYFCFKIWL